MTNNKKAEEKEESQNQPAPKTMYVTLIILACILFGLIAVSKDYVQMLINLKVKTAPLQNVEQNQTKHPKEQFDTEVKFRKFYITAPGAKKVELLADFNGWGARPVVLKEYNKSYFDTTVAMSAGEYKYVFLVDGVEILDPTNKDRIEFNGREVCIKTVR